VERSETARFIVGTGLVLSKGGSWRDDDGGVVVGCLLVGERRSFVRARPVAYDVESGG
jgi:hypothetical protein